MKRSVSSVRPHQFRTVQTLCVMGSKYSDLRSVVVGYLSTVMSKPSCATLMLSRCQRASAVLPMLTCWLLCRASTLKRREDRKRKREEQEAADRAAAASKAAEPKVIVDAGPAPAEDGSGAAKRAKTEPTADAADAVNGSAPAERAKDQQTAAVEGSKTEDPEAIGRPAEDESAAPAAPISTENTAAAVGTEDAATAPAQAAADANGEHLSVQKVSAYGSMRSACWGLT